MCVLDICRVFLYTDLMITLARQIQLKLKKFDELMIKLKIKYNDGSNKNEPTNSVNYLDNVYGDLHKLDEKIQEISKLVDSSKNK